MNGRGGQQGSAIPPRPLVVSAQAATVAAHLWPKSEGKTAHCIRELDWSATSLGPAESWPQSLRTVIDLILGSSFPMAILWGADLLFICNDAYRVIVGDKHPGMG